MGKPKIADIDEGFRVGLRPNKWAIPNGQGLYELKGLRASSDGAVYPTYQNIPTTLYNNMLAHGIVFSWPFPQFCQGKRTLYIFANTASAGRVYSVDTDTWAVTHITPFTYFQNTGTTIAFDPFTKPFHFADFWTTWFATNGDVTLFGGTAANYGDSATYGTAFGLPFLSINSLCEHRGSLYFGGIEGNAAWNTEIAEDRRNMSNITTSGASRDRVWKSMTGGGNTLSLIVPSLGHATQEVSDPRFTGSPAAAWAASGAGWTFGTYSGSTLTQTLSGVTVGDLYRVAADVTFSATTDTIQFSLGTEESPVFRGTDYGVGSIRIGALIRADATTLTVTCAGGGSCTNVTVTTAFSKDDDNMRLDTDSIFIPSGEVQQIHPMRDYIIVASREGISRIRYYQGIGLGCDIIHTTGVKDGARGSIGGYLDKAAILLNNNRMLMLEGEGLNEVDYSWNTDFASVNTASAVGIYDPQERNIRFSTSTLSFLVSDTGVSQVYNPPTSNFTVAGTIYQMYTAAVPDPSDSFEYITDTIDFGTQTVTQLLGIEISSYEVSALTVTIQMWLPDAGAWIDTAVSTVNPDIFCPIAATGNRMRIKVGGTSNSAEAKINSMKVHYVGNDQRISRS